MGEGRLLSTAHISQHFDKVMRPAFRGLGPGDEEPLINEVSNTLYLFPDQIDRFSSFRLNPGFDKIGMHANCRRRISDFMRKTRCDSTESGKSFGLMPQFLFTEQ